MSTKESHEQDTVKYLECTIRNNNDTILKVADFNQSLTAPLIEKASDYYVLIQSFNIDRISLPIFTYQNNFVITFERGGDFTINVPFINRGGVTNGVYYVNQLVQMLNAALTAGHTASGASGTIGNDPPFIYYNPDVSNKFTLYIPTGYNADIYFNESLADLFAFESEFLGYNLVKSYRIINRLDQFNANTISGTEYNEMENQEDTLWRLSDVRGLIITTNTLPITKEIISFEDQQSNYISTNVLQRFFQLIDVGEGVQSIPFEYVSQYDNYLVDLISPNALTNIGFTINVLYKDDRILPLLLEPGEEASIKLKFIKKAFYFERDVHNNKITPTIGMKQLKHRP